MKVLHICPHLGGGIGKALAAITSVLPRSVEQTFLLLEKPINKRYESIIKAHGTPVIVAQGLDHIAQLAREVDIVQFEFINHPRIFECLARTDFPEMRSVIWAHISGLFKPYIPPALMEQPHRFVLSSPVSLRCPSMRSGLPVSVINSGFGFGDNVRHAQFKRQQPVISYLGTVNFVKMHPCFFDAIDLLEEDIKALIWGMPDQRVVDYAQTKRNKHRFTFCGETDKPAAVLAGTDIFFYPLQRQHYGTGENSLVEAMSLGLAVIVMNNPAELEIVSQWKTGFVASSIPDCVRFLRYLINTQPLRDALSLAAVQHVQATRTAELAAADFVTLWQGLMRERPKQHDFRAALGNTPADWFLATQRLPGAEYEPIERQVDATKGSLAHFAKVFAGDQSLAQLG